MRARPAVLVAITFSVTLAGAAAQEPGAYAPSAALSPTLFADGVISTVAGFETHPAFSLDDRTLYFITSNDEFSHWTIKESHLIDGKWSTPVTSAFSGTHRDADPFITLDGKQLYFISDRPVGDEKDPDTRRGMDIWVMQRDEVAAGGWSQPRNLGQPINSRGNEWYPTIARDGTIYFGSDRRGGQGRTDLYCAKPKRDADGGMAFEEPVNLGPIVNSAADEYEPFIDLDQRYLIFMASGRPGEIGGGDLYITFRKVDPAKPDTIEWTPPQLLGHGINTPQMEISASVSRDGKFLYFGSVRPRAPGTAASQPASAPASGVARGDIYVLDAAKVLTAETAGEVPP